MHPAQIQANIKIAGLTQQKIAENLGVSPFHISEVIHKKRPSNRVMTYIAEVINKQPQEVFPEYYFRKIRRKRHTA